MFRYSALVLAVSSAFFGSLNSGDAGQRGTASTFGIPTTIEALMGRSSLVVRARVTAVGRPEILKGQGGPDLVVRRQTVQVLEEIKADPERRPGTTVTVVQQGGTVRDGDRTIASDYSEDILTPGKNMILFLLRSGTGGDYWVHGGPGGAWKIDADGELARVNLPKAARSLSALSAKQEWTVADIVETLRRYKEAR